MSETTTANGSANGLGAETARIVKPPRQVPLSLMIGGGIVGMFLILAAIGPYITPYPFDQFHLVHAWRRHRRISGGAPTVMAATFSVGLSTAPG